jgi:parallel beta-helix repeat protein
MNNDLDRRFLLGGLAGAAGISALSAMARGGPLNPPAGAVTSTAKPLAEVEPRIAVNAANTPGTASHLFRISQPGSYYLTANIQGVAGKGGIEIAAGEVTLDLCGFLLQGVPGSTDGIASSTSLASITVMNGVVRAWGASGVTLFGPNQPYCRLSGITAVSNGGAGINVRSYTAVSGCTVANNASGITAHEGCAITDCIVRANSGLGISSFSLGVVSGCTVTSNPGGGIRVTNRNKVIGNLVFGNGTGTTAAGIHMPFTSAGFNHIEGNTATTNGRGYHVESPRNILIRNVAGDNTEDWNVSASNLCQVIQGNPGLAFTGTAGGAALAASGYDPNANVTIA